MINDSWTASMASAGPFPHSGSGIVGSGGSGSGWTAVWRTRITAEFLSVASPASGSHGIKFVYKFAISGIVALSLLTNPRCIICCLSKINRSRPDAKCIGCCLSRCIIGVFTYLSYRASRNGFSRDSCIACSRRSSSVEAVADPAPGTAGASGDAGRSGWIKA